MPGGTRLQLDLCGRGGFSGRSPCWIYTAHLQLLNSSHVRERDKDLLRSVMVGGVWIGFLLGRVRGPACPMPVLWCPTMVMVTFFGECTFPPLVEIRENPEFHDLMRDGKNSLATGVLLGHGWLAHAFCGVMVHSTWTEVLLSESLLF